jgi:hypothetical protein
MTIRRPVRHVPRIAAWRSALAAALTVLTAFAPMARAMCDLKHVGTTSGAPMHADIDRVSDSGSHDWHSCCVETGDILTAQTRSAAADAATPSLPVVHYLSLVIDYRPQPIIGTVPVNRRHPLPPSESAFRRVPKLLI